MIALRAHHLLCIFGWRGDGYSRGFTENLDDLISRLSSDSKIELVEGADDVCIACPNVENDRCRTYGTHTRMSADHIDRRVLERLELKSGETHRFHQLIARVKANIAPNELSSICGGCDWLPMGWCAEGLKTGRF